MEAKNLEENGIKAEVKVSREELKGKFYKEHKEKEESRKEKEEKTRIKIAAKQF